LKNKQTNFDDNWHNHSTEMINYGDHEVKGQGHRTKTDLKARALFMKGRK